MLDSGHLELVLSGAEKALAFRRRNVSIERSTITRVQLSDDPWTWLRGVRAPGTYIPGTLAIGTWQYAGGKDFALLRKKRPGVVIDLDGHDEFQRLIVGTRHGMALVTALRVDAGDDPTDIVDLASA